MNSTERIKATINGEKIDRVAFTSWGHMPMVDNNIEDFTNATIALTENNSFDFVKLMYNGYWMTKAYGGDITVSKDPAVWSGTIHHYVLQHPHDYEELKPLEVFETSLKDAVEFSKKVVDYYKGTKPVLGTMFTPLTFIKEMTLANNVDCTRKMMKYSKKELHKALEAVTETSIRFTKALLDVGVDGLFYATHFGTSNNITDDEFEEFCRPYDLAVLDAMKGSKAWFTMMHIHENKNLMIEKMLDYPVEAFNWEDNSDIPEQRLSISKVRSLTDKVIIGGIDQNYDFYNAENDREAVKQLLLRRLDNAMKECGGKKFIFGPGCGCPCDVPPYRYTLIKEAVEEYFGIK